MTKKGRMYPKFPISEGWLCLYHPPAATGRKSAPSPAIFAAAPMAQGLKPYG